MTIITIIDEMLELYPNNKGYVLDAIGITEDEVLGGYFDYDQLRNAINFYLKEKAKC